MELKGSQIYIRPILIQDAETVLIWENDRENWIVSGTTEEYVLEDILDLIDSMKDINQAKQTRLIICKNGSNELIGAIDLFDIQFDESSAGIGVLIADNASRRKGYALEAIMLAERIALEKLNLSLINCSIHKNNLASLRLFEKARYVKNGVQENINDPDFNIILFNKWLKKQG